MPNWIKIQFNYFLNKYVDQIWASSNVLYTKLIMQFPSRVEYIPNGVDLGQFKVQKSKNSGKFTIGYVGIISSWFFDFELIKLIANTYKDSIIRLVGPIDPLAKAKVLGLSQFKNIKIEGIREYKMLPKIMSSFNVGLIPLIQSEKVYQLNSGKFLQYLAINIPIISVPFNEFVKFKDSVYFCKNDQEFLDSINSLILNKNQKHHNPKLLKEFDWDKIAKHVDDLILKCITKN